MILPILEVPHPTLRKKAKEIKKIDQSIKNLAKDMIETKRANFGIGLAAPQVGELKRLIVVEAPKEVLDKRKWKAEEVPLTVLVNPKITKLSKEKEDFEEGCLSLPGLAGIVPRPKEVEVEGTKLNANFAEEPVKIRTSDFRRRTLFCRASRVKIKASGLFARILQHEIDHLERVLFSDKAKIETLKNIPVPYKIIFLGTPEFAVPVLKGLIKNGWGISLIITEPDKPVGRKQILTPPPVKKLALKYNLVVYQPEKIINLKSVFLNLKPDIIILAAYGQILPKEVLEIPKYGSLCLHPSLLPKYRGPSPIQTAILNGEKETGVTIIKMDEKVDHGPIIASEKLNIEPSDTSQALFKKLSALASKVLLETLPQYLSGKIKPKNQNHQKASFTKLLKKEDGKIDWSKKPKEIERQIRAFSPWPKAWTIINGKRIIIHKAHMENSKLILDLVQSEGKKPMQYEEYLKGNPKIT